MIYNAGYRRRFFQKWISFLVTVRLRRRDRRCLLAARGGFRRHIHEFEPTSNLLDGRRGARMARQTHHQKHLAPIDLSPDNSGISRLQDRNLVLVVDDDPGILEGLQRLLQLHAYEPILFSSAEAFKNHADFEQTVCVILDINLNDGSGIDLRHRLKAAGISVPVIYMTGNEDPTVREAALASGCIAFLTKPFSAQELMEPLKRAGRHRNSGDAL
ncbi:response regulator transcription factor [Bradyrhizobium sp.]|uniref:response regulator transcription factor n=1 Tax=Bradyrhizobium sp. TaxID=376 RepID=UPI003C7D89E1